MFVKVFAFLAVVTAQPLVSEDVPEPSVANEVRHALARVPPSVPPTSDLPFATNGLDRTRLAIRLVSTQRADGRWLVGTNDVTASAVRLLEDALGFETIE